MTKPGSTDEGDSEMFKMATAYFGFRNMTSTNYFSTAAALGVRNVEVPMYSYRLDKWFGKVTPEDVVALASRCGVRIVSGVTSMALAPPFDTAGRPVSVAETVTNAEISLRVIDIAERLGIEVLRIAEPMVRPEHQQFADQYMIDYGKALRPIGEYAAERGVTIAVENYGVTIDQMESLLGTANHPNVGTLFDPCNYERIDEDSLDAVRRLSDRIVYCHLKDSSRDETRAPSELFPGSPYRPSLPVGDGDMDWSLLLPQLSRVYDGYVSIEHEDDRDVVHGTARSLAFLAKAGFAQTG